MIFKSVWPQPYSFLYIMIFQYKLESGCQQTAKMPFYHLCFCKPHPHLPMLSFLLECFCWYHCHQYLLGITTGSTQYLHLARQRQFLHIKTTYIFLYWNQFPGKPNNIGKWTRAYVPYYDHWIFFNLHGSMLNFMTIPGRVCLHALQMNPN